MGQTDFDTIGLSGTAITPTAAQFNLLAQGVAAGYKLARGSSVATATLLVDTGLSTVVNFAVSPGVATAGAINKGVIVSAKAAATAGKINIYRWKHTAATTSTLVAATACMVSHHGCIRVFKEAQALINQGVIVDLITEKATFGFNIYRSMTVYHDREQLTRSVAASDADIFHVHNEPDWLVSAVRAGTDKPIIFDAHDLESLRWNREPDQDELDSFGMAAGWVHVSDPCRRAAEHYHGNGKPSVVLPSFVNEIFTPTLADDVSWNSIVYEGGLSTDIEVYDVDGKEARNFRNYIPVVEAFAKQGFIFFLFAPNNLDAMVYERVGGIIGASLHYPTLLRAMRPFAFGLVGSSTSYPLMEAALPNKLYEYISQGVVPVCYNAATAADFCEKYGVGIRLDGLDDLKEQLKDGQACRERILAKRHEWTMEANIEPIKELYEAVL
jgi:hypothetical protein